MLAVNLLAVWISTSMPNSQLYIYVMHIYIYIKKVKALRKSSYRREPRGFRLRLLIWNKISAVFFMKAPNLGQKEIPLVTPFGL